METMRSAAMIRAAKTGYIIMSVLVCALGLALIIAPKALYPWLGRVLGIVMIVFGGVKLAGYLSRDLFRLAFQYDLAFGILLAVLGVLALSCPHAAMGVLSMLLGIPVLADGLFKIQIALDARTFGIRRWWVILGLAALTCGFDAVLLFPPSVGVLLMTVLMGISLLLDGILNLCVALLTVKIVTHQKPDIIEIEEFDIKD